MGDGEQEERAMRIPVDGWMQESTHSPCKAKEEKEKKISLNPRPRRKRRDVKPRTPHFLPTISRGEKREE